MAKELSEGEVRQLRRESGLNGNAGHQADLIQWEQSESYEKFVAEADDRDKAEAKEAKDHAKSKPKPDKEDGYTEDDGSKKASKRKG